MTEHNLLEASCRVALAAFLHDLGKFAERAALEEAEEIADSMGNSHKALNTQEYCPQFNGRYSHVHAAYTAIAMGTIEKHLPDIKAGDCFPFSSWSNPQNLRAGDSIINGAARHHKPETFLQWIIATADRLASGFERSEFDTYNQAEEGIGKKSYLTARMQVLLETIRLNEANAPGQHRYPLQPLSPLALFPVGMDKAEPSTDQEGRAQYRTLWNQFMNALGRTSGGDAIPASHKKNLALWLDHFDTLWLTYTQAIPSATAAKMGGKFISIPADVSLYDHSKTTAALATALWRWHYAHGRCAEADRNALAKGSDTTESKLLLIQGDLFGIQNFIFQSGGSSNKFASKLLRGRSFYVSLLTECAALRVLDDLGLPPTSQITNAAGKFLIVAPNTDEAKVALAKSRQRFEAWSIEHTQGRAGLGLVWTAAAQTDFIKDTGAEHPFGNLMNRLFTELELQKHQRLNLLDASVPVAFTDMLARFESGACELDGISPVTETIHEAKVGSMAADQIRIGDALVNRQRLLISRNRLSERNSLKADIFGYHIHFTDQEDITGKFGAEAASGNLLRCWDFSLPTDDGNAPLWNGYARRNINGYVPRFSQEDLYANDGKYKQFEDELDARDDVGEIKTLNHLACEDRLNLSVDHQVLDATDKGVRWQGVAALQTLKGDVDNLGAIFQSGLSQPTFARMAALSRQMNSYFAIYLPWLCQREFPNTYTVFAGGDDFFLIGPWQSQMKLALRMQKQFAAYVAHNPDLHFSAGFHLSKPGLPIRNLAEGADEALDQAKSYQSGAQSKNAVTCFGQTLSWSEYEQLFAATDWLHQQREQYGLSTSFVYGLLQLSSMAETAKTDPHSALWRSWLTYRTFRWMNDKRRQQVHEDADQYRQRVRQEATQLLGKLAEQLGRYGARYHLPLTTYLYTYRD